LEPWQVEADAGFLLIGDDWHAHLARAHNHLLGRLTVDRDVALGVLHAFFAKELLRSNAPGSSWGRIDRDAHDSIIPKLGERLDYSRTASSAAAAASIVWSVSDSVWASDTKAASNCDGARYMPRSSMAWKNAA